MRRPTSLGSMNRRCLGAATVPAVLLGTPALDSYQTQAWFLREQVMTQQGLLMVGVIALLAGVICGCVWARLPPKS